MLIHLNECKLQQVITPVYTYLQVYLSSDHEKTIKLKRYSKNYKHFKKMMVILFMETIISSLLELLDELYVGPASNYTWVIDRYPGHGFTKAIEQIDAEQASTPIVEGGSTIAAHTEHLRWSIRVALEFFDGKMPSPDWTESWRIHIVNDEEWQKLQQDLLSAYNDLRTAITERKDWTDQQFRQGTLALVPHAAYHLGAIKQLIIATS